MQKQPFSIRPAVVKCMGNLNRVFKYKPSLSQSNCPWWIPQNCKIAFCPSKIHYVNAESCLWRGGGAARAARTLICRATSPALRHLVYVPQTRQNTGKFFVPMRVNDHSKFRGNQETLLFNLRILMNSCWERKHHSFLPLKFTLYTQECNKSS